MSKQTYLNKYDARNVKKSIVPEGERRVAIYVRVSTEHEQQMNALENQKKWAIDLASDHKDWVFNSDTDLFVEEGLSGTSMSNRPEFSKMIKKAKDGEYDLIVTREVSRFMRNASVTFNLVDELLKYGVEVYFVNDAIWTTKDDDRFKLSIMAQYAEQESRKVSERVFSGQAIARQKGVLFGNGNILGYRHIKGERSCDTTYEIDEEQAETVRKIYELALQGNGIKKIKHYLMDNGYLTAEGKTVWYESTIERILRRSTYMGEITHMQSVTQDPLSHKRMNVNKSNHMRIKVKIPQIIEEEMWHEVQKAIDSRVNHYFHNKQSCCKGKAINKDINCRKLRCGCGRRFKKDYDTKNNTSTYRCYALVDDGSQESRIERSAILQDNCCIYGIRDWKLDLFTLKVFDYLEYNADEIKEKLLAAIDVAFVGDIEGGYTTEDKLKIDKEIEAIRKKNEKLLVAYEDGVISLEVYKNRKSDNELKIAEKEAIKAKMYKESNTKMQKDKTLKAVKTFLEEALAFPSVNGIKVRVPEVMIDTYVNSIKACADNIFEYNIRINPDAPVQIPNVPDEDFNPQNHSACNIIDNSSAVLIAEFTVNYDDAKEYANSRQRKVKRVHFDKPATIRIYANLQ